ncbi:UDP-N-acetylglucosamine 1-carboxyvinyltransferase [Candidatus Berkelbacteria bacterium RIFCSPLOWO2_01_FULL_50_28]|uniref:UDP-N-acetylglucosamine 1-carboxyvinyltransferase n=1 Tax=Candidatus Berkelbacteria bacterium RIFCSPLOWO2_01_FULL_50_28 TaxID=1797471 RepID=A0A1F5EBQ7_9BACT|nr:MAG: UDP-N-acetylglucosamine 1-carboxyvinyltransferase [Candidatus Berkelbacteria bacterium RIFCSPHIGHO2_01_FULL_50_36]OGD63476.1 MAG: UDP-N-acetylglucosamine 1-carboxyvinyltransferase [Candidatus Berkelbacteria bacterium RIFCSPHIGHO2_12_FULL_50_11]OGD64654.1 MAG: UDP-N-acetylglucosamine 1-carboxyvinyltransferase [Candidatus Berkelbacteria bacterium RIFCSPLOWO2_01_FULL_50_28]
MSNYIRLRGGKPLVGEIVLRGGKNVVPKLMVAALLTDEPVIIRDVPKIEDVEIMTRLFKRSDVIVDEIRPGTLQIIAKGMKLLSRPDLEDVTGRSRIPILMCGPMLHRFNRALVPKLGGCNIGPRPVDFHVKALRELGANYDESESGGVFKTKGLRGAIITLEYPSVGATEQVILSTVLADGVTELHNAAVEPEIMDLIMLLQQMGAIISVDMDRNIIIEGVEKLGGAVHTGMPDRNETASWACAALGTNGRIFVRGARQLDMMTFLNKFRQVGGGFDVNRDGITFYREQEILEPITVETDVHPGFMTDWQQPLVVALTQAHGKSVIHETVYESRFGYIDALNQMGAKIKVFEESVKNIRSKFGKRNYRQSVMIQGPTELHGADITVPDLRAGFSYIVAALIAKGDSTIHDFSILQRGYEHLVAKLQSLEAEILEVKT